MLEERKKSSERNDVICDLLIAPVPAADFKYLDRNMDMKASKNKNNSPVLRSIPVLFLDL